MQKHSFRVALAAILALALTSRTAEAHLGDRVFPVWEIPSADIPDLHDGSLADWDYALPSSSIDTYDFTQQILDGHLDLESLAFRVFLAWNQSAQKLYVAVERLDDVLATKGPYDYVVLMVDGDHSGGQYVFNDAEQETQSQSQAQAYFLYMRPDELPQSMEPLTEGREWAAQPAWSDVGSYEIGERPNISSLELSLTLWDELSVQGPEASKPSILAPGKIIGLQMFVLDADELAPNIQGLYSIGGHFGAASDAGYMTDAQLVPCYVADCSSPPRLEPVSIVNADSWARIKASLR